MKLRVDVPNAILDAAEALLERFGFRKMTMDDVAREAGIGKGSIYLHFESKADVALSTIDRLVGRVVERLEVLAADSRPAGERLCEMLQARVMIRFDAVRGYSESLDELLGAIRSDLLERRKGWFRKEARVLARVLAEGSADGELVVADPAETARDLIAATNAFLPYSLTPRELGRRADVAARVLRVGRLLVAGLRAS